MQSGQTKGSVSLKVFHGFYIHDEMKQAKLTDYGDVIINSNVVSIVHMETVLEENQWVLQWEANGKIKLSEMNVRRKKCIV